MARIELREIRKSFDGHPILRGLSLTAEDGEFLVLVGPSGCGKSTLLRTIAGLEEASSGEVWLGERRVDALPPRERDLAMVFQSYALYPHLTVADNLAFGLTVRKTPRAEVAARVREVSAMLGLDALLARYPRQLSGGQRQRVAMGRALVRRPLAFLFDEPLSNLDATLRGEVRVELKRLHAQLGATMVYVTHDQVEAMTLATRIAVLRSGLLLQHGTPAELYERPLNRFVASFIGSPPMNFLSATVRGGGLEGEGGAFLADPAALGASISTRLEEGRGLLVGVRAQELSPVAAEGGGARVRGTVDVLEPLGPEVHVHLRVGASPVTAALLPAMARALRPGTALTLAVAPGRLHLFDPATEQRVG